MSRLLELLLEPWQFQFMVNAIWATTATGVVCGVLSCWLVLIGWALLGDAVSHAVLPGVVLAYLLGWPFALGAAAFGLLAVALIGTVRDTSRVKEDAAIGIVFTTLFALGLVLVSVVPSQIDLNHIVFGNVLGVSRGDLVQVVALSTILVAVLVARRRDLTLFAFDPVHAHAIGLNTRLLSATLLVALALASVVALQTVGVILVVAMLIIPGATAHLLTDDVGRMLVLAPAMAVGCGVVGLYLSYYLDIASGAAVVVTQGAAFFLVYLFSPRALGMGRRTRATALRG